MRVGGMLVIIFYYSLLLLLIPVDGGAPIGPNCYYRAHPPPLASKILEEDEFTASNKLPNIVRESL